MNLADLYREQKKEGEGERVLRQGIAAAPKAAEIRYFLGLLLVRQKRPAEALPQLREADSLRPDLARYALATFSRDRGRMQDAVRYAMELAAVAPEDPGAKRLLKELESGQGGNS